MCTHIFKSEIVTLNIYVIINIASHEDEEILRRIPNTQGVSK